VPQVGGAGLTVRGQPTAKGPVQPWLRVVLEVQAEVTLEQAAEPVEVRGARRGAGYDALTPSGATGSVSDLQTGSGSR
jgi:hypothetical protein